MRHVYYRYNRQRGEREGRDDGSGVGIDEEKGGGMYHGMYVVVFILVCVDGVVDEGPGETSEVERETDRPGDGAGDNGPAKEGAPVTVESVA